MEKPVEFKEEPRVKESKRVDQTVAQKLWRAFLTGSLAAPFVVSAAERGYSYLFSESKLAERVNDADAFLNVFGKRLETFRSREAEEVLGLARANVLNLSELYYVEIDWQKVASLPGIEKLRGASLILIITDDVLSPGGPQGQEYFESLVKEAGVPKEEAWVGGSYGEIGGARMFFPGIDDFVIVLTTASDREMSIEDRTHQLALSLIHETGHLIDFRREGTIRKVLEYLENPKAEFEKRENFAEEYEENNQRLARGLITLKPIIQPTALSPQERGLANEILIKLQIEAQLGRLEPAQPYWKKGIEV